MLRGFFNLVVALSLHASMFFTSGFAYFEGNLCYEISRRAEEVDGVKLARRQKLIDAAAAKIAPGQTEFASNAWLYRLYSLEATNAAGVSVAEEVVFKARPVISGRVLLFTEIAVGPKENFSGDSTWKDNIKMQPTRKLDAGVRQVVAVKRLLCQEAKRAGFEVLIFRGSRIEGVRRTNGSFGQVVTHVVDLTKIESNDVNVPVHIE